MSDQPWFQINRDLLVYKAFYFFFLSGFGSIFPYLPVYFRQIGLPASQVGLLLGLRPIVQFASAPFWAIMADKYRKRKSVLVMSVLAWLIMTLSLAFVEPTDEICEIRAGNDTHKRVVNYTKVKTGFFKRSLLWHEEEMEKRRGALERDLEFNAASSHLGRSKGRILASASNFSLKPRLTSLGPMPLRRADLNHGKSGMTVNKSRTFNPRNAHNKDTKKRIGRLHKGNDMTLQKSRKTDLDSNFRVGGSISNNASKTRRVQNKREPTSKTRPNNKVKTTTSRDLTPPDQQINNKHFSRFHGAGTYLNESKRRVSFLRTNNRKYFEEAVAKNRSQLERKNQINSNQTRDSIRSLAGFPRSGGKVNLTSNSVKQWKSIGNRNSNMTADKRRESKGSPPVVIEFSRIVIPQSKDESIESSVDTDMEDGSGHFGGLNADHKATFVSHETSLDSAKLVSKKKNININPVSVMTTSSSKNKTSKAAVKAISKNLLQLGNQLSQPKVFDPKGGLTQNNGFLDNEVQVVSDNSESKSNFLNKSPVPTKSLSSTPLFRIHVDSKNNSNGKDNLHPGELHKPDTEFVLHHMKPDFDVSVVKGTNSENISVEKVLSSHQENQIFPLADLQSGSGVIPLKSLFSTKLSPNSDISLESEAEKENKEEKEGTTSEEQKLKNSEHTKGFDNYEEKAIEGNLSGNLSVVKMNASSFIHALRVDDTQLAVHKDESQLKIWMRNLLKTNAFELKRLFTILLILVVVGEFLEAPSSTLADASLLEHLGEERRFYGKQRLWGSLGFGLSSFMVGILLERSRHAVCGDQYTDYMICFCVFAVLMLMTLFISTTFKFKYKETKIEQSSVFSALFNIHYGSCLVAACFMGVGHGMSHSFLNWFLEDLGATKTLMGVAVICRSTFDLLTFFLAGSLIKAVGQIKIMAFALVSYGVAFTLYSLLSNPWWVLPIEMLVGCTYAASWSACTSYMAGAASPDSVTTIQGILQGVYWGLGTGSGTITGGFLIHHIGAVSTFRVVACTAYVVCVLFCLAQCRWTHETTEYPQTKYTYLPTVETKDTEELLSGYKLNKASKNKHSATRRY